MKLQVMPTLSYAAQHYRKLQLVDTVTVVADDTDILVLLVYHWQPFMAETYMKWEASGTLHGMTISIEHNIGC